MGDRIDVSWPGGTATFEAPAVIRLGRGEGCDVVLDNPNVSRHHAELRHDGREWVLEDSNSTQGTFVAGTRTQSVHIANALAVTLGAPPDGEEVTLRPLAPYREALTIVPSDSALAVGDLTRVLHAEPARTVVRVECLGYTHEFSAVDEIVLGRSAECDVVIENPSVSRRHAAIRRADAYWRIDDLGSTLGIFVNGQKTDTVAIAGATTVWLGTEPTGERVVVNIELASPTPAQPDASVAPASHQTARNDEVASEPPPPLIERLAPSPSAVPPPVAPTPAFAPARRAPLDTTPAHDAVLLLGGGIALIVGAFMPWARVTAVFVGTLSVSGTDGGDGYIAIALSIPLIVFALRKLTSNAKIPAAWSIVIAVVVLIFALAEMGHAASRVAQANQIAQGLGHASIGIGLWTLLAGGVLALVGGIMAMNRQRAAGLR